MIIRVFSDRSEKPDFWDFKSELEASEWMQEQHEDNPDDFKDAWAREATQEEIKEAYDSCVAEFEEFPPRSKDDHPVISAYHEKAVKLLEETTKWYKSNLL